jgi:hypothetical protein
MLACPQCGDEYRPGIARCNRCDVELVDPDTVAAMGTVEEKSPRELLEGRKTATIAEAGLSACRELEKELLHAGIPAYTTAVEEEEANLGSAGIMKYGVIIAEDDLAQASEALKDRFEALVAREGIGSLNTEAIDLEASEVTCPACGHTGALDDGACADCGLFLGAPT